MNKVILMGRLTSDPEVRYSSGDKGTTVARYTLAVDRNAAGKAGENNASFIPCVAFGKAAEFAEKYFHQGTKIVVTGRIRTGSYTNRDGNKVYTTDVIIEEQEFAESKGAGSTDTQNTFSSGNLKSYDGFVNITDGLGDELPFR